MIEQFIESLKIFITTPLYFLLAWKEVELAFKQESLSTKNAFAKLHPMMLIYQPYILYTGISKTSKRLKEAFEKNRCGK